MPEISALTDRKVSIVVPCFNEEENILALYSRLKAVLDRVSPDHEILYIDNASADNSERIFRELAARDSKVRVLLMSRNFRAEASYEAGLENAAGDCVVCIDGDQQDPPEVIEKFLLKWLEGYQIVYGVRHQQEGNKLVNFCRRIFYRLLNRMSYIEIPLDAGEFALYDRRVVDIIVSMPERSRFLRGLRAWVGFKHTGITYMRADRAGGQTSQSLVDYLRTASRGISSFSYVPLELISWLAFATMGISILGMFVYGAGKILYGHAPQGFATLILVIFFLGGVQLLCLSIIGGYLGRIFEEVKHRPKFIIRESIPTLRSGGGQA